MSASDAKAPKPAKEKSEVETSKKWKQKEGRRYKLTYTKTTVMWEDVHLRGDVTIGEKTYIGPGCIFFTRKGPIVVGDENVFTENVRVVNESSKTMYIGNQNVFESGAKVQAAKIGNLNKFGAKSVVMADVKISNGCVITPRSQVINGKRLDEGTIVFGENASHKETTNVRRRMQHEVKRLLKKFQKSYFDKEGRSHLKKPTKKTAKSRSKSTTKDARKYSAQ